MEVICLVKMRLTKRIERNPSGVVCKREVLDSQRERRTDRSVGCLAVRKATAESEARWIRRMAVNTSRLRPMRSKKARRPLLGNPFLLLISMLHR